MVSTFVELFAGAALLVGALALLWWVARTPAQHEGTQGKAACPRCGYSTTDLVPLSCPECGDYLGVIDASHIRPRVRWLRVLGAAVLYTLLLGGGGSLLGPPATELLCITRCDRAVSIVPPSGGLLRSPWARVEVKAGSWRFGAVYPPPPADWVTIEVQVSSNHDLGKTALLEGTRTRNGWLLRGGRAPGNKPVSYEHELDVGPGDVETTWEVLKAIGVTERDPTRQALAALVLENLALLHADGSKVSTGNATGGAGAMYAAASGGCVVGMPPWMGRAGMVAWVLALVGGWFWIVWKGR